MSQRMPPWMVKSFSALRLTRYLRAAQGDVAAAQRLYWWNIEASSALFGPLHCLELALRNALHHQLTQRYSREAWWEEAPLDPAGRRLVTKAHDKCARRGNTPVVPGSVVAELTFGFWTALLSRGYDRHFWVPVLHRAFPHYRGRRDDLYDGLSSLVLLRNRIMHHEPIHHRDLAADHAKIYRMLGSIDARLAEEAQAMDRFPAVLARRQDVLRGSLPPRF
ncbi:hypothetical protein [Streptomyces uncialis]|uniref:hypothetical protein n=1 Tax=Streptomyces uncialis TaxID=1048205 RepID=UPI003869C2FA|nr:hypothetical protein OG268_20235 [Streptomyces uncialis]